MINAYRNISYFFLFLFLVVMAGFYKTYIGKVPNFQGLPFFAHIHFTAFFVWFAVLIVQPFSIRKKQLKWHRYLGYGSYLLIPLLVFTLNELQKIGYERDLLHNSKTYALEGLINTYLDITFFVAFYAIALIYRGVLPVHICFIVSTSLVLLGPGLGSLTAQISEGGLIVLVLTYGTMYLIIVGFIIYDISHQQLADELGTTGVVTSRILKEYERKLKYGYSEGVSECYNGL